MENTTWKSGLLGDTRVFNNKYEFRHHSGMVVSFDSEEELKDYIQACFENDCDLSQNS